MDWCEAKEGEVLAVGSGACGESTHSRGITGITHDLVCGLLRLEAAAMIALWCFGGGVLLFFDGLGYRSK